MTSRALEVIGSAEVIVGYHPYVELIADLTEDKEIFTSGMRKEVERCQKAVELALSGKKVALVSSGDPGVYGMAGLVLELVTGTEGAESVQVEVVAGVTAATAAAAQLGAPLMHDFAIISLSDLLTPWELILRRVECAALGDYVIALYNPKSKKRIQQIVEVQQCLLQHKEAQTPVGIVRNVGRQGEEKVITTLGQFLDHPIDMFTTIIIGNSQTYVEGSWMITPRGYRL
ncbi:precorrin-3B C(17)-methyltransferase [Heliorestis convoluta]|uniref:Precorrin-3B C17-methyltransferase n=1 Tax=Heliorestis convoluta TaxID=356322 RepID=A0A5Q2N3Q0_9FIRM|nr:precorrin-3B C(17)-methyltransferase [Heliorestis convoluta]QGG46900.1 precorrin-3B C17-methyltransferase [Heliorestis convoluta]